MTITEQQYAYQLARTTADHYAAQHRAAYLDGDDEMARYYLEQHQRFEANVKALSA